MHNGRHGSHWKSRQQERERALLFWRQTWKGGSTIWSVSRSSLSKNHEESISLRKRPVKSLLSLPFRDITNAGNCNRNVQKASSSSQIYPHCPPSLLASSNNSHHLVDHLILEKCQLKRPKGNQRNRLTIGLLQAMVVQSGVLLTGSFWVFGAALLELLAAGVCLATIVAIMSLWGVQVSFIEDSRLGWARGTWSSRWAPNMKRESAGSETWCWEIG
jgi:hypothetical protein